MNHLDLPFTMQDIPSLAEIRRQNQALGTALPEVPLRALLRLMRVGNDVQTAIAAHLQAQGISTARFVLLAQLMRADGHQLTPSELAEGSGVTRATVTGLIDGLANSHWVERKLHPGDRRSVIVQLTEAGIDFLRSILPDHAETIVCMIRHIPEEDLVRLETTLDRVEANIEALDHA